MAKELKLISMENIAFRRLPTPGQPIGVQAKIGSWMRADIRKTYRDQAFIIPAITAVVWGTSSQLIKIWDQLKSKWILIEKAML